MCYPEARPPHPAKSFVRRLLSGFSIYPLLHPGGSPRTAIRVAIPAVRTTVSQVTVTVTCMVTSLVVWMAVCLVIWKTLRLVVRLAVSVATTRAAIPATIRANQESRYPLGYGRQKPYSLT